MGIPNREPEPPSNDPNPIASAKQSCPLALPASCKDAPKEIELPKNVNDSMQSSYKKSFPDGKSQEHGGTLVTDSKGNIKVVNEKGGTSGTFSPDRKVGPDEKIIGTHHTHPYDASEGGHTGVSFSGADIAYANAHKESIYVDAGTKQFMITPTGETGAVDPATIKNEWNKEYANGLKAGKNPETASAEASNSIAKKHKMAYYEGKDGKLKRVSC